MKMNPTARNRGSWFVRSAWLRLMLAGLCLFGSRGFASGQALSDAVLKQISFDQKPGAQVSPDLEFRDENGKVVKLGDYFGKKPVILVLGYYECPMLCTFVLNGMVESLLAMKPEAGDQFEIIDISINPTETPALAAAKKRTYLRRYGKPEAAGGWHFLTGDEAAIRRLTGEVGFNYAYDPVIKQYAHPSGLIILTPSGKVSHYLSGVIYSPKELNHALTDAAGGKVGSPIRQLFLLCFHYSPITGKYGALVMTIVRVCGVMLVLSLGAYIAGISRRTTPKTVSAREAKTARAKT